MSYCEPFRLAAAVHWGVQARSQRLCARGAGTKMRFEFLILDRVRRTMSPLYTMSGRGTIKLCTR